MSESIKLRGLVVGTAGLLAAVWLALQLFSGGASQSDPAAFLHAAEPAPSRGPTGEPAATPAGEPGGGRTSERRALGEAIGPGSEPTAVWTIELTGESGEPVARARMSVRFPGSDREEIVAELTGEARLSVDAGDDEGARVLVEAWAPGYQPLRRSARVAAGATAELTLEPGYAIFGRCVDGSYAPVPRAEVHLEQIEEGGTRRLLTVHRADADGRFSLGVGLPGSFALWSRESQVGRSEEQRFDAGPSDRIELGDVVLAGDGVLAGRVVFPDGGPVEGLTLSARLELETGSAGLRFARSSTDESGKFRFEGLARGGFRLEPEGELDPGFRGEARFESGREDVVLVLEAVRVTVRAVDGEGHPASIKTLTIADRATNQPLLSTSYGEARERLQLVPPSGRSLLLSALGLDHEPLVGELDTGTGEAEREVVLRPVRSSELAALEVRLTGPDGELLDEYELTLSGEPTGTLFLTAPDDLHDGRIEGLPAGKYSLEIDPRGRSRERSDLYIAEPPRDLQVAPGQVAQVAVAVSRGGHLEVDLSEIEALHEGQTAQVLVRRAADSRSAFTPISMKTSRGAGHTVATRPTFGSIWRSARPLPPEPWLVRVEARGFRAFETSVDIRAGQVELVQVSLELE